MAGVSINTVHSENTELGDCDDVPKVHNSNKSNEGKTGSSEDHDEISHLKENGLFSSFIALFRRKKPSSSQLRIPPYYSSPYIKGIVNLGNTCYLGSILQCLNQTIEVFSLLTDANHPSNYVICGENVSPERTGIKVIVNGNLGPLGKVLYDFFVEINCNESSSVLKPTKVLSTIRQCNKIYQGCCPQDSHEVFRTILDFIRNEECEEIRQAIYNHFGVTMKSVKQRDEDTQKEINAYLRQAQKHCKLVSKVFGGKMVNIIICRECSSVITIEEDFFDLSIPIKRVEKTSNCYNHKFEFSSNRMPEQQVNIESSPQLSLPIASILHTEQKHSTTSEFVERNKSIDSVPDIPSITKPADDGSSGIPKVTVDSEAMHQHQYSETTDDNGVCDGGKVALDSSVASCHDNSSDVVVKCAEYTTNENLLQLHLKKENVPYRVLRSEVDTDLEAGLQAYFELDVLDEHNKFKCDVCTALRTGEQGHRSSPVGLCEISKQLSITSLPEILVIHMKRFNFGQQKSSKIISFPLILNMAPYCTNTCLEKFADFSQRILYGLYGVVEHRGASVSGGHYVVYVRRRSKKLVERSSRQPSDIMYDEEEANNRDWYFVDDRQVRKLRSGFEDLKKCQAYMLFYERLPVIDSSLLS